MKNEEQQKLKAQYAEELKKVWPKDPKMVEFCFKKTDIVIDYNGKLFNVEKPHIETRFCFSAGYNGYATQEDMNDAETAADNARTSIEHFVKENMRGLNETIGALKKYREEMCCNWAPGNYCLWSVTTLKHYWSQPDDCKLYQIGFERTYDATPRGEICRDTAFIDAMIAAYEQEKENFAKRLQTYLKKYGLSKLDIWTDISE